MDTRTSVEFWSAADPEHGSCVLNNYPRLMTAGSTVNFVSGDLVACYNYDCEDRNRDGNWLYLQSTTVPRTYHSSAATQNAVLLIGGDNTDTTEWIPLDGSPSQPGPFTVRHGRAHCTIQISADAIVVTGGSGSDSLVTQYQLVDGNETPLTPMVQARRSHACVVYQDISGQQVSCRICTPYYGEGFNLL